MRTRKAAGGWVAFALGTACGLGSPASAEAQIAVISHLDTEVTELSSSQLRDLFVGRILTVGTDPAVLIENRGLRDRFYPAACEMSVRDVKRRWISVVLSGGGGQPPIEVEASAVLARVAQTPRAISFIEASLVDGSVRVLRIDGRLPGEPGYPLR